MAKSTPSRDATATIRGYNFQFDATILKLLQMQDGSTLIIEGVEDFDESAKLYSEYSQVKYYAAQKLSDAVIRDVILPMIAGFLKLDAQSRETKKYTLYGHFKDTPLGEQALTTEDLKRILVRSRFIEVEGKRKLEIANLQTELAATDDDLTNFALRFKIVISHEYLEHQALVRAELKSALNAGDAETDGYIYPSARTLISDIAARPSPEERSITKAGFLSEIRPNAAIYNEWALREEAETSYCRKMKSKYFSNLNVDTIERFFVFSGMSNLPLTDIVDLTRHIVEKWSTYSSRTKPDKERFAPYIFFPGLSEQSLVGLKRAFFDDGLIIADGYPFLGSALSVPFIQEQQTKVRPIAVRFIGNVNDFSDVILSLAKPRIIIQLFINQQLKMPTGIRQIAIPVYNSAMAKAII